MSEVLLFFINGLDLFDLVIIHTHSFMHLCMYMMCVYVVHVYENKAREFLA